MDSLIIMDFLRYHTSLYEIFRKKNLIIHKIIKKLIKACRQMSYLIEMVNTVQEVWNVRYLYLESKNLPHNHSVTTYLPVLNLQDLIKLTCKLCI